MVAQSYDDPLNEDINTIYFADAQKEMLNKVNGYRSMQFGLTLLLIFFAVLPIVSIWSFIIFKAVNVYLFVFSFIPFFGFYAYIKKLQNELFIYLLCEKKNWAFNPATETVRADKLATLFPDVFKRGETHELDDQIWGAIDYGKETDFWSGTFSYTGERQEYPQSAFIIKLDAILACEFTLYRWGSKSTIRTESEKFNELFKIFTIDDKKSTELQIIKVLSPSIQVRLIDFATRYSLDCIAFERNCMIVLFSKQFWQAKHTNFFKSINIDQKDLQLYEGMIQDMIELPSEMIKYLD
jgi:hypothetical protein